jgi:hypothetical protein
VVSLGCLLYNGLALDVITEEERGLWYKISKFQDFKEIALCPCFIYLQSLESHSILNNSAGPDRS